jgi:radical SAM protein with 4Fe4S-binding SPASM domain
VCLLVKDRKLALNYDGTVSTCSNDLSNRQLLGSLNGSGLAETWDSPRFQDFYNRKVAGEKNPLGFCGDCDRNHV